MSIQSTLANVADSLDESLGIRQAGAVPRLAPQPNPRDTGRRPDRCYGQIDINRITPDPKQPRTEFDNQAIDELAQNICENGQLSPIRVRWCRDQGKWIIVAGERRWRAARQAGLSSIACYFHERDLSATEILQEQLIENIHRQDLKPIEEAKAFQALMDMNEWTGKELANVLSINTAKICRSLALLKLPAEIQEHVEQGTIAARSAYELSRLDDTDVQARLANRASAGKLTHDQAAKHVRKCKRKGKSKKRSTIKQVLFADGDWAVTITNPKTESATYAEIEQALLQVLDEVRLRLENNVQLF